LVLNTIRGAGLFIARDLCRHAPQHFGTLADIVAAAANDTTRQNFADRTKMIAVMASAFDRRPKLRW
jgi:hypothetical protein